MNLPPHIEKRTPLSSAQRRLYLQCQLPGGDRAYHLLYLARVRGSFPLDGARAFAARMMDRHESLRTAFRVEKGEFLAEVHRQADLAFTVRDENESALDALVEALDAPYELSVPPLFRLAFLRLGEREGIFVFNCHHLVYDGYSAGILTRDLLDAVAGRDLAPLERTYSDFVAWESAFFQSAAYEEQRDFWRRQYPKAPKRWAFPPDFPPPAAKSFAGDYFIRYLDSQEPKAFSMSQGATLYMTLLAAFYCVLYKLSGQEREGEITVGTLVSPRESGHFQNVIGLFANTLPLTQFLDPETPFSTLLQNVRTMVFQAMQHADFPFEHLIRQLPFLEKGVRNPLFDIVFNFERVARQKIDGFGDVAVEPVDHFAKVSMFDLSIDLVEYEDQVRFKVEYATTLFREESMQGLMDAYFGIIGQVCRRPDIPVGELSLISEETRDRLRHWNDTGRALKKGRTFLDLWKAQAAQQGDNPALRLRGREWTYGQLEARANRWARVLTDRQIGAGSVVAVALDRSCEWVIALLALWKAGAVYLPLSAAHPPQRLRHQLTDSRAVLTITEEIHRDVFTGLSPVITPEALNSPAAAAGDSEGDPGREPSEAQPAYIIYTSGSTGTPKGVLVDHRARIGERIRVSGGGHCNVTNIKASAEHYLSRNPHFCRSALARFTSADILAMLDRHAVPWEERQHGQVFCVRSAQDVVDMLRTDCDAAGVHLEAPC
nr:condensation domain-containing protein [Deltaproteobacteria bacterium]